MDVINNVNDVNSVNNLWVSTQFWFNQNLRLAIPRISIPYGISVKFEGFMVTNFMVIKENAVNVISRRWRCILSRRRLCRLRICQEISVLPGIGFKYFESLEHFNNNKNKL